MREKRNSDVTERLKKKANDRKKKEKFIRTRMWFYTFASMIFNDRGKIPPNIGNNIMITNNLYITKNSLSAIIIVNEFSNTTPISWTSDLLMKVKDKVPDVTIDFSFKNQRHYVDLHDKGLQSRMNTWAATLNNPFASPKSAARAARLLYAVDVLADGVKSYHTRTYITVRSTSGTVLSKAINEVCGYLSSIDALYRVVKSKMQTHLEYISIVSDKPDKTMKDVAYTLQTSETLAESLPTTQGMNDTEGSLLGVNKNNYMPYQINFRASSNAKNLYVGGRSGFGKTFLVVNWLLDFFALKYGIVIQDIKGTEFTAFTQACGGVVISLRQDSPIYVNTFVWNADAVLNGDYRTYTDRMLNFTKQQLMIMCDYQDKDDKSMGETLIETFLQSLYVNNGVLADNPNTWKNTEKITPFRAFEFFERYVSYEIRNKYGKVAQRAMDRLRMFLSPTGSYSHMFTQPVSYEDVLDSPVLTFDFGLIDSATTSDTVAFKLRFLYTRILSEEYCAYRKRKGLWTVDVMEESQIVDDEVMAMYTKAMTLGRAQNKINIMLGNSISALVDNKYAKASLENFNIFVLGVLNQSSIDYVVKEFNLREEDKETLNRIQIDPEFEYTFLLINRMQKNATTALLKAYVPDRVRNGKLFKVVDTVEK